MFSLAAPKRRVFFSFHYQNDIWRANQVRNSWRRGREAEREGVGFYDASIWETARRTNEESLKNLIREGITNSSVTCVLTGSSTYLRRWVRYEIARSVIKGNGLLSVNISSLLDQNRNIAAQGPNPLDFMGVYQDDYGAIKLAEFDGTNWIAYRDYSQSVSLPATWGRPNANRVIKLSSYGSAYCYVRNGGAENFSSWVQNAAAMVGR